MKIKQVLQQNNGFTLIELLTVIAIMSILMGLMVGSGMGDRVAGVRNGAICQVMQGLEEARMSAIEYGTPVHFGIADTTYPNSEKQLHAYILFRDQTAEEKAAAAAANNNNNNPGNVVQVPLTAWQTLPQGFYFDADKIKDSTSEMSAASLPGNATTVRSIDFNSLGEVTVSSSGTAPQLTVASAVYDQAARTLIRKSGGLDDFTIQVYRLTGRVQLVQGTTPQAN